MAISTATAMTIAAVASIAAAGVGAYSAIQSGNDARAQANAQAQAQQLEGQLAESNAREMAAEKRKEAIRVQASQEASATAAGIGLNSESFLNLMADTSRAYAKDIEQLQRTGRLQMASAYSNASLTRSAGKMKQSQGYFQAGTSLLNGISSGLSYGDKAGWFS